MGSCFRKVQTGTLTVGFGRQNNPQRANNSISTTKYNLLTFLPKALLFQFTRVSNFVYLISAALQTITLIASLAPITAIGPLMFVLAVGIIRQGFEDYVLLSFNKKSQKRHQKDVQVNERLSLRLNNRIYEPIEWQDIQQGDIIKVKNGETIPCDMVVLYTTEENSICYVQTANLDGENNLKTKFAFVEEMVLYPDQFELLQGSLQVDQPNSQLYQFNGQIKLTHHEPKHLSFENILLRQTVLKNTAQVVGVAVYCGVESKIIMNKGHIQHKITKVEKRVNVIQIILLLILCVLCIVCSFGYYLTHNAVGRDNFFYLKKVGLSLFVECTFMLLFVYLALLIFFTCFLLLNFLIPISLNVLIEFIKAILVLFIGFDNSFKDKYCPDGIHVSNMSIIEELGVVDYVLTDKTGTLTSNEMVFRSCCIQDCVYQTAQLQQRIGKLSTSSSFHNFWICLLLCHDIVKDNERNQFQGSSPDEVCFMEYARKICYEFVKRTKSYIELSIQGQKTVYELLHVFPFDSRRRMSVIVRAICDDNQILLFTKGADSAIFSRSSNKSKYHETFVANINDYAKEGLRTLVFAYRKIEQKELNRITDICKQIKDAKLRKLRPVAELDEQMRRLIEETQTKLNILGASAIEDKLQDQVPETIARLQLAGITVMMITGDKLETAENIGYLANLIKRDSTVHRIREGTQNIAQKVSQMLNSYDERDDEDQEDDRGSRQSNGKIKDSPSPHNKISVIIEGGCIRSIVQETDPSNLKLYSQLLRGCGSVIFCRSSPKEKALIVKFVKQHLQGTVLAIGDGGNDTGMIEEANVGVGIMGKEGNGAAAASDFYFGQFRHLDRLLLHHGRWFYLRISYFFVYYGWKNLIMTICMFFFMINSGFSGFPAFSDQYIVMYNMLLGMLIISYYGAWAQDINDDLHPDVWHHLPELYRTAKQTDLFSFQRYIFWSISGIIIAVMLEFYLDLSIGAVSTTLGSNGFPFTYNSSYITKAVALLIVTFTVILMDFKSCTLCTGVIFVGILTIGIAVLAFIIENFFQLGRGYRSFTDNADAKFWFVELIVLGASVGMKLIINTVRAEFYPSQVDKILAHKNRKGELSLFDMHPRQISSSLPSKDILCLQKEDQKRISKVETEKKFVDSTQLKPRFNQQTSDAQHGTGTGAGSLSKLSLNVLSKKIITSEAYEKE